MRQPKARMGFEMICTQWMKFVIYRKGLFILLHECDLILHSVDLSRRILETNPINLFALRLEQCDNHLVVWNTLSWCARTSGMPESHFKSRKTERKNKGQGALDTWCTVKSLTNRTFWPCITIMLFFFPAFSHCGPHCFKFHGNFKPFVHFMKSSVSFSHNIWFFQSLDQLIWYVIEDLMFS